MMRGKKTSYRMRVASLFGLSAALLCGAMAVAQGVDGRARPASITVAGQGASPNSQITLSTGPGQTLVAETDAAGNFVFSNLMYSALADLKFTLDLPPNSGGGLVDKAPGNRLDFFLDPRGSKARVTGTIGKSGLLTVSLAGSQESMTQIAGAEGYVSLQTRTGIPVSSGEARMVASILNAGEVCCPRLVVPAAPVTITVSSLPVPAMPVAAPPSTAPVGKATGSKKSVAQPQVAPVAAPQVKTPDHDEKSAPAQQPSKQGGKYILPLEPKDKKAPAGNGAGEPKKKAPYIIQGHLQNESVFPVVEGAFAAASFSEAEYDDTYVGGLKKSSDDKRNSILLSIGAMGSFMDGRNLIGALRTLQFSIAESVKKYTVSDSLCRFGTLSRSLAYSDAVKDKNRLAFSKIMADRNNQKMGTVYADSAQAASFLLSDFSKKYCESVDNTGFLASYCTTAGASADLLYNRDVDFTRTFDVPWTFNADFTSTAMSNDKQSLIALFHNLALSPFYSGESSKGLDPNDDMMMTQDMRAINAAREVAENSFGALVAEKTSSSSTTGSYMTELLGSLGVSAADAGKLVGASPSYFAQMEVMTKRIYQDPRFYANLYESAANIDRQRVAMKAIELQQERDLLDSLRRREMLLSVLLSMKTETEGLRANESGTVRKK